MAYDQALNPNQEAAIVALLSEPTIALAAKKAGVGERSIYNWLKDPAFAEGYREARREAVRVAIARLQQGSGEAVTVLRSIARNTKALAHVRVAAASRILDLAIKAVELEDLKARLVALEEAYARK